MLWKVSPVLVVVTTVVAAAQSPVENTLVLLQLQASLTNSGDGEPKPANLVLETLAVEVNGSDTVNGSEKLNRSNKVNGGTTIEMSVDDFGTRSSDSEDIVSFTWSFMANGPWQCKSDKKPMCTGEWGYHVRTKMQVQSSSLYWDLFRKYHGYVVNCGHLNEVWFIACFTRNASSEETVQNSLWEAKQWCKGLDSMLYSLHQDRHLEGEYPEATLNYIKGDCEAQATQEAVARLVNVKSTIFDDMVQAQADMAAAQALTSHAGPPGEKGPEGEVGPPGPSGPEGARGLQGLPGASVGPQGLIGLRGRSGLDGRDGTNGTDGKMIIPDAASCKDAVCPVAGQFCPPNAPGSDATGYCCGTDGYWKLGQCKH